MSEPRAGMFTFVIAAALALLPSTVEAGGDAVFGNRGGELLTEREHEIELTFARGHAELRVTRTVHNGIERHDEAQFWLAIPEGSVATRLRSLGELNGKPKWFEAELLEAEAAAARYRELTGLGGYYPKDPALLSWRSPTDLALQVFPVAPGTEKTVEYTLEMPASWWDGRWHIALPSLGTEALPAEVTIVSDEALDQLFVDGEVVPRGHSLTLDRDVEIALAPTDPEPYTLSLASVATGERHFARWNLVLAPEISKIPSSARIVLVLDLSRSIGDGEREAQRQVALSYLEHFRDPALGAQVALLGFDREVHELSAGFVSAEEARKLLEGATLQRRNGSEIGLALDRAAELLASSSKREARRIVLFSDFETAARVRPDNLEHMLTRSNAIAHLVAISEGGAELLRDDGHDWAPLAAASRGVFWTAAAPSAWSDQDELDYARELFEELARPTRIDQLTITVEGLSALHCCSFYEPSLAEGQGVDDMAISSEVAKKLVVDGLVWNTPLHETASASKTEGDRWSALVFGTNVLYELSEPEMMTLAMRGGAVSPVTSYLAIEPGVRPSTEGLETWETGGLGLIGMGGGGGSIGMGIAQALPSTDKLAFLEAELRSGWRACGGGGVAGEVSLETGSQEVLDVTVTDLSTDTQRRACMQQVTWSLELRHDFEGIEFWTITL